MLTKRLLVASILLPLFYLSVMKLPPVYFFSLLLVASIIAHWEFYSMYRIGGLMKWPGIGFGILLLLTGYIFRHLSLHVLLLSVMGVSLIRLLGKRDPSSSLKDISFSLLALFYVPGLLFFQLLLRDFGPEWIIFIFGCVWVSDSFAYSVGKTFGKRKLYEEVSPNKTVAGAFGSLVGGSFSAWLLNLILVHEMALWETIVAGLLIGAATVAGDLVESMFKRDAGVKDSSGLIPGHGGMLDKIDGVLFAAPVFYWISTALRLF